jgi:DNA-binding transcriptional MerR regulator
MTLMAIGEFGERTRLSPKALRLYEQLGLVEAAQLVGLLRRLDMPLALIGSTLALVPSDAAIAVTAYVAQLEGTTHERRALASSLRARLLEESPRMYDIKLRTMPERKVLTINRHVLIDGTDTFFDDAFARLRAAAPGLEGIAGVPFIRQLLIADQRTATPGTLTCDLSAPLT